jgi:queuine tRNA-ribosyltransferase
MNPTFSAKVIARDKLTAGRVLHLTTPHGDIMTPAFMPVGTRAYVNCMRPEDLRATGSQIILGGNTFHMLCDPGLEVIESVGGMHAFMNWHGPMLTDSGGFQVYSLSHNPQLCRMKEDGAYFRDPKTGRRIVMTPEISIHAQKVIGADIMMAFDECAPDKDRNVVIRAMHRTHRWLQQCCEYQAKYPNSAYGNPQALFGIVQGGLFRDLREESLAFIASQPVDGIALGGESIGEIHKTEEVLSWLQGLLPEDKCRYTMGVGLQPEDLIMVVKMGIDLFDCVAPTRNARHGSLYCGAMVKDGDWFRFDNHAERGRVIIKKSVYAKDERPIQPGCGCYTCLHFTRAYLHYLFKSKSPIYTNLATIHNVFVMQEVCRVMRDHMMS